MQDTTIIDSFIEKLIDEKGPDAAVDELMNIAKFSAAELFSTMMLMLTDEDLKKIEEIADEETAEKEMVDLFKLRTNLTPEEFVQELQQAVASGYLEEKNIKP